MVWPIENRKFERAVVDGDRWVEMTVGEDTRDPAAMREELADLSGYLEGLPDEIRRTGAFTAYDQRAGELSRELILTDMRLKLNLPGKFLLVSLKANEYGRMYESLSVLTKRQENVAQRSVRTSRTVEWAVALTSAGTILSELTTATALVLLFSSVAALLAFIYVWFSGRARKREQAAMRLSALLYEVTHSFGPAGQVLRPSEYYSASTKRIESLLNEVTHSD